MKVCLQLYEDGTHLFSKMQIYETLLKGYEYGRGTYKTPCPKDMIMSIMSMENKTKLLIVLLLGASGMREIKINNAAEMV